jgi:hypothetical protein
MGKEKDKFIYLEKDYFTKTYSSFYNNKKFTDFTIKIESKKKI